MTIKPYKNACVKALNVPQKRKKSSLYFYGSTIYTTQRIRTNKRDKGLQKIQKYTTRVLTIWINIRDICLCFHVLALLLWTQSINEMRWGKKVCVGKKKEINKFTSLRHSKAWLWAELTWLSYSTCEWGEIWKHLRANLLLTCIILLSFFRNHLL